MSKVNMYNPAERQNIKDIYADILITTFNSNIDDIRYNIKHKINYERTMFKLKDNERIIDNAHASSAMDTSTLLNARELINKLYTEVQDIFPEHQI